MGSSDEGTSFQLFVEIERIDFVAGRGAGMVTSHLALDDRCGLDRAT